MKQSKELELQDAIKVLKALYEITDLEMNGEPRGYQLLEALRVSMFLISKEIEQQKITRGGRRV